MSKAAPKLISQFMRHFRQTEQTRGTNCDEGHQKGVSDNRMEASGRRRWLGTVQVLGREVRRRENGLDEGNCHLSATFNLK